MLGIVPADFRNIQQAKSLEVAESYLDTLKMKAKKGFREAARKIHPDVAGDAADVEQFHRLTAGMRYIEALTVTPPKRRIRYKIRKVY